MNKQETIHTLERAKLYIFGNRNSRDYSLEALGRLSNAVGDAIYALEKTSDKNCSKCIDKGKCAIHDNFNIDYCSDWRCEDE